MTSSAGLESKGQPKFTCSSWDPHHNCVQIATANDTFIRGWDLRNMQYEIIQYILRLSISIIIASELLQNAEYCLYGIDVVITAGRTDMRMVG